MYGLVKVNLGQSIWLNSCFDYLIIIPIVYLHLIVTHSKADLK